MPHPAASAACGKCRMFLITELIQPERRRQMRTQRQDKQRQQTAEQRRQRTRTRTQWMTGNWLYILIQAKLADVLYACRRSRGVTLRKLAAILTWRTDAQQLPAYMVFRTCLHIWIPSTMVQCSISTVVLATIYLGSIREPVVG